MDLKDLIQDLTLRQIKEISSLVNCSEVKPLDDHLLGRYVIIRTYSAGVHFGIFDGRQDKLVRLKNTQRIWYWEKAFTLSAIAKKGLGKDSKISEKLEEIILTEVIEIIPCSEDCIKSIEKSGVHG